MLEVVPESPASTLDNACLLLGKGKALIQSQSFRRLMPSYLLDRLFWDLSCEHDCRTSCTKAMITFPILDDSFFAYSIVLNMLCRVFFPIGLGGITAL